MDEKRIHNLQYQGYKETPSIFTTKNNPFEQELFHLPITSGIPDFTISKTLMLGKRVEVFFQSELKATKTFDICFENIQVQKERRTIGELDIIIQDTNSKKITHVEIAYKFYLYDPNITGNNIEKWIGPNRNDNLSKKINKLSSHQFPLLFKQETKDKINLDMSTISQAILFKAQIFIPLSLKHDLFPEINSKAICGYYVSFEEFKTNPFTDSEFCIPSKQNWLCNPKTNENWYLFPEIIEELQSLMLQKRAPLIWRKNVKNETHKLFITWW